MSREDDIMKELGFEPVPEPERPDCHKCRHSRSIPGDAHIRCAHPKVTLPGNDPIVEMISILLGAGRCSGPVPFPGIDITASRVGVEKGYFAWPFNFDPIWLVSCTGYELKL